MTVLCFFVVLFFCCLLFFLLILPPPRSTLFPYTTLFRSLRFQELLLLLMRMAVLALLALALSRPLSAVFSSSGDRKSTRLNSSHSQISYAVFCLKKKKKYDTMTSSEESCTQRPPHESTS